MRKTRRQKDGCSFQRVLFIRMWITLYSCTLDLMYASVHHLWKKNRSLLCIYKYFPFYDSSGKYLCKNLVIPRNFRNQIENIFVKVIIQSMPTNFSSENYNCCQKHNCFKWVIDWGGEWFPRNFYHQTKQHSVQRISNKIILWSLCVNMRIFQRVFH